MDNKIRITKRQVTKSDPAFHTENAVLIRFENVGQRRVWLDEHIVIDPGQAYIEGDNNGPGIDHRYQIDFLGSPKASATEDEPKTYAGDRLHIRLFKRHSNA